MSKKQKQQALLAVLVMILLVAGGRRLGSLLPGDSFGGAGGRSSASHRTGSGENDWKETLPQVEQLQLGALEAETGELSEGRDPFQTHRPEPPPRPQPEQTDIRKRIEEARQRQLTEVSAPARPPVPSPPPIDVVYLGSFGTGRMRLAVFTDGKEIFNVPEGDILKKRFVVVKIGMESADLGFVGFPDAPAQRLEIGG